MPGRWRAVGAVLLTFVMVPAAAHGATPSCGTVLHADTRLTADVRHCRADGLVVPAGVTLDLNGHTVSGAPGNGAAGIRLGGTVRDGRVKGFGTGVVAVAQDGPVRIDALTLRRNGLGLDALGPVELRDSAVLANHGDGVGHRFAIGSVFADNEISGNGGRGIDSIRSDDARYERNVVAHNGGDGMRVQSGSSTFTGNVVVHNGGHGILAVETTLSPEPFPYVFGANTASFNAGLGIAYDVAPGVERYAAADAGGNVARSNGDERQCLGITCAPDVGASSA